MKKKVNFKAKLAIVLFIGFLSSPIFSQSETKHIPQDSTKKKKVNNYFELSLGQTTLFISNAKLLDIKNNASIIVPTNAKLFFAELRPIKKIKIPVFFNSPTENKQYIVDSVLVNDRASPTFGAGLEFRVFKLPIALKSSVELEIGPLASFLINQNAVLRFAPVVAGRFRFIKNEDFVIYLGSSYSIGINAFGILSGVGYVF